MAGKVGSENFCGHDWPDDSADGRCSQLGLTEGHRGLQPSPRGKLVSLGDTLLLPLSEAAFKYRCLYKCSL